MAALEPTSVARAAAAARVDADKETARSRIIVPDRGIIVPGQA